jgi:hypothetical protein
MIPDRSYISKEEMAVVGFKSQNDRLMLLLGSIAKGGYKLKPLW